jgi:hypothetical protein
LQSFGFFFHQFLFLLHSSDPEEVKTNQVVSPAAQLPWRGKGLSAVKGRVVHAEK